MGHKLGFPVAPPNGCKLLSFQASRVTAEFLGHRGFKVNRFDSDIHQPF